MPTKVTPLSIDAMKKQAADGHLWIINNTSQNRSQSLGEYFIEVLDESGSATGLRIPATWVPIDLASYVADPLRIFKSDRFIEAIRKRNIVGISEQEVENFMRDPNARTEAEKVSKTQNIGFFDAEIEVGTGGGQQAHNEAIAAENEFTDSDRQLIALVSSFNKSLIDEEEAINALKEIAPAPTDKGLKEASGQIGMTSSRFYFELSKMFADDEDGPTPNIIAPVGGAGLPRRRS